MVQPLLPMFATGLAIPIESRGVVYTKPWVVELILDLAGYAPSANLVDAVAVEPAAGEGAFLVAMVRRLISACRRQGRPISDCSGSLVAFEIDEGTALRCRRAVTEELQSLELSREVSLELAEGWVRTGDFLAQGYTASEADFVIGNPPYVRLEDIPSDTAGFYRDSYPTMRGRADIYVAFFEAGLRRLKKRGVCAFICADRWMLNQYGAELRRLITRSYFVRTVVEMHDADAFDTEVSAYPAITVIQRERQGDAVVATAAAPKAPVDSSKLAASLLIPVKNSALAVCPPVVDSAVVKGWFHGNEPWPCHSLPRLKLLRRLEARFQCLEDGNKTRVGIGVATGCDSVFITTDAALVESSRLLPLAMAFDTASGAMNWSGRFLVNPWDEKGLVELQKHPKMKKYLESHQETLNKRHTAKNNPGGWYKTIDRVSQTLTLRRKLYIPDIKDKFNPVLDTGLTYPHHNLYYIVSDNWDLEVLGGLLLSSVAQLFIEAYGVRMRGGYLRFQAQYLRRLRVPDPARVGVEHRAVLIRAFRHRDREEASRVAAEVYGLTVSELEAALER